MIKKGVLVIPAMWISVPLYEGENAQEIVDVPNSAVWFRLGVQDCIADHCYQERFSKLSEAVPGKTLAWVYTADALTEYICVRSEIGHLVTGASGSHLRDAEWNPVYKQNAGGLCIYTCTGKTDAEVTYVILTYWQPRRKV